MNIPPSSTEQGEEHTCENDGKDFCKICGRCLLPEPAKSTTTEQGHCPDCAIYNSPSKKDYVVSCKNKRCVCHQLRKSTTIGEESWEKRFDKLFWLHRIPRNTKQTSDIKSFFRKEIASAKEEARKEGRNEAVDYIEKHSEKNLLPLGTLEDHDQFAVAVSVLKAARSSSKEGGEK